MARTRRHRIDALLMKRREWLLATAAAAATVAVPAAVAQSAAASAPRAVPPEVAAAIPGARLQGEGRLRFIGMRIYDARLWSGEARVEPGRLDAVPFALELEYARGLVGRLIAERSLKEMRRQREIGEAEATRWLGAMTAVFPDVAEGDRITGIHVPGLGARFAVNGQVKGDIRDLDFARLFFGIWLSDKTSEPALRTALLGTP